MKKELPNFKVFSSFSGVCQNKKSYFKKRVDTHTYFKSSVAFALVTVFMTHFFVFTKEGVTVSAPEQLLPYSLPIVQGNVDRLAFAIPQMGDNGTGITFVPFSVAGSTRATTNDLAYAVGLQPDGCIVIAGTTQAPNNNIYFAIARYLPGGELDPTFGGGLTGAPLGTQYVPFNIAGGRFDQVKALGFQSDGKIIFGGVSNNGGGSALFAIARFTATGQLDPSFGQVGTLKAGTQFLDFFIAGGGANDIAAGLAVQSDNKIVVGGVSNNFFAVARFFADGQLDTSFNQAGTPGTRPGTQYVNFNIAGGGAGYNEATSVALQPNGQIILGGIANSRFAVARFTPTGQLDTFFGRQNTAFVGTQYVTFLILGGGTDQATCCGLQSDGKVVVGGWSQSGGAQYCLAACFSEAGILDTVTFGNVGTPQAGTTYVPFSISGQIQYD